MKKLITMMIMVLAVASLMAQAPEKFSYQAVVRNASNALVTNVQVSVRVSILQGSASGNAVYVETQTATTNANGLLTLEIGGGIVQQGSFAGINWANGPFFLKTETDPSGGSNYTVTSTQQLLSVPYALYSKEAGNGFSGDYNDLTNLPQIPQIPANVSAFSNDAGYITGYTETDPQFNAWDKDYNDLINRPTIPTVPSNVSEFSNDAGYITMDSVPAIPTNVSAFTNDAGYLTNITEQQVLSISNDTIFLTGGSFVKLPAAAAGFSGDYNDLINTPTIPIVPTNVGAFTNDAGYITSYTETDPQFNAWDKDYDDLINTPVIPTVPTNVSAFTNDAGYLTSYTETDPNVPAWAKEATKPAYDYSEIANTPVIPTIPTNVSAFTNDAGYLTSITEQQVLSISNDTIFLTGGSFVKIPAAAAGFSGDYNDLVNTPEIPTVPENVSAFTNDAGYITNADIPEIPTVPTNVSAFQNDAGYLTNDSCNGMAYCQLVSAFNQLLEEIGDLQNDLDALRDSIEEMQNTMVRVRIPVVVVDSITNVSQSGAKVWVSVTNDGGDTVSVLGFCWGTQASPTSDGQHLEITPVQNNHYFAEISDLQEETTYFVRAYATNKAGMAYSENITFTTTPTPSLPAVNIESLNLGEGSLEVCGSVTDDGGIPVLERGFCWGYDENPTVNETSWQDNNLIISVFCHTIGDLEVGRNIHVRVYAVNATGVAYSRDTALLVTNPLDGQPCPNAPTMTDADGNVYPTVQLGRQCWIAQNLRTTQNNAEYIPLCSLQIPENNGAKPGRYYPDDDPNKVEAYGYMYNWAAVLGKNGPANTDSSYCQGICPDGWHVPSLFEWRELKSYVGAQPQYRCDNNPSYVMNALADSIYASNINCANPSSIRNSTGFSLRASGWYFNGNSYGNSYSQWSSSIGLTGGYDYLPHYMYTGGGDPRYFENYLTEVSCMAVRCVKNPEGVNFGGSVSIDSYSFSDDTLSIVVSGVSAFGSPVVEIGACWAKGGNTMGSGGTPCINYFNAQTIPYNSVQSDPVTIKFPNVNTSGYLFLRAFINLEAGTVYSDRLMLSVPTVTTLNPADITDSSASVGGIISNNGGYDVTVCGVCWSTSPNPTVAGDHTTENAGTGIFTSNLTGLEAGTTYYVRAYAINMAGTAYGDEISFTTTTLSYESLPCPTTPTVTDFDGNVYNTVQIGDQCWMKENLRTTHYADGTSIALGSGASSTTPYYYNDESSTTPLTYRGYHYNWMAVMHGAASSNANPSGVQGVCPMGWHVPSDAEWLQLTDYVKSVPEYTCSNLGGDNNIAKALAVDTLWYGSSNDPCAIFNDLSANNATGFSIAPAGLWWYPGYFYWQWDAYFCSSTVDESNKVWLRKLTDWDISRYTWDLNNGYSVRCLRD